MAEPQRLTEARVHELADALFAELQKRPSAQAIVAANGNYGSAVSAGKYLKTWQLPTAPASQLSTPLQAAISGIQEQLEAESRAKIEAVEVEAARKITEAEENTQEVHAQLDAQLQEMASLHEQLAHLQQQLTDERLSRQEAEDDLQERRDRVAHLQGINEQQREALARAERTNDRLQTSLLEAQQALQQTLREQGERAAEAQATIANLSAQLDAAEALAQHNQDLAARCRHLEQVGIDGAAQTQTTIAGLSHAIETLGQKVDKIPVLWQDLEPTKSEGQTKKSRPKQTE